MPLLGPPRNATTTTTTMHDCRTPPDVVPSACARGRPPEPDSIPATPLRRPARPGTQGIRDNPAPDCAVTSSPLTSVCLPLTSSTPACDVARPRRTASPRRRRGHHVDFRLDETPPPTPGEDAARRDFDGGGSPELRRANDLEVLGQSTTSMIVIGEDDVDELFQSVCINGDSFALLQAPVRSSITFSVQGPNLQNFVK